MKIFKKKYKYYSWNFFYKTSLGIIKTNIETTVLKTRRKEIEIKQDNLFEKFQDLTRVNRS